MAGCSHVDMPDVRCQLDNFGAGKRLSEIDREREIKRERERERERREREREGERERQRDLQKYIERQRCSGE